MEQRVVVGGFSEAGAQVGSRVNDRRQALQEQGLGDGNQFAAQWVINIFPDGICRTWMHDYSLFLCQAGKSGCDSCLLWAVLFFQCPCLVCWQGRGLLPGAPSGVLSLAAGCTTLFWPLLSLHSLEQSQSWLLLGEQVREEHGQKWSVPAAKQPDLLAAKWRSCI